MKTAEKEVSMLFSLRIQHNILQHVPVRDKPVVDSVLHTPAYDLHSMATLRTRRGLALGVDACLV